MNQDEIKESLTEIGVDTVESVVQLVLDDPIFSSLPILGTTYKLGKIAYTIPNILFCRKVERYLHTLNKKTTSQEREKYAEELRKDKNKADALYERFLLRIEKFDDIDKPGIYAKIFACYLKDKITKDDCEQLGYALSVSSIQNLYKFSRSFLSQQYGGTYNEQADMESLAFCGLTSLGLVETTNSRIFGIPDSTPSGIAGFTGAKRLPYGVNFSVTELGKLYAFIAEDLEDFFSLQINPETGQKSYQFFSEFNHVQLRDVVQERLRGF